MSNYYDYREVKVMIAHKLMAMDGWKVYGYKEDRSDSMTDYYDPANWNGVAEKNGYVLCVDVYGAAQPEEIRKYNYDVFSNENIGKYDCRAWSIRSGRNKRKNDDRTPTGKSRRSSGKRK